MTSQAFRRWRGGLKRLGRRATHIMLVMVVVAGIATPFLYSSLVRAGAAYSASQQIGQPDFTSGEYNRTPEIRATGVEQPAALALDTVRHRMFVADTSNRRVLVFMLDSSNHLDSHEAAAVLGAPDLTTKSTEDAPTPSTFLRPVGLAYDASHDRLFVVDQGNGHNRVLIFNTLSISSGMGAAVVLGAPDFTTFMPDDAAPQAATFVAPAGVAYDALRDQLYVADSGAARVLQFDVSAPLNGQGASHVLGQAAFDTDSQGMGAAGMVAPGSVAVDESGARLFVADAGANRVTIFDVSTVDDGEAAVHVLGQAGFDMGAPSTSETGMAMPGGVAFDSSTNRLAVSDTGTNRVILFDTSAVADGQAANRVFGQPDFTSAAGGLNAHSLAHPAGVVLDPGLAFLYVADYDNNRVLVFDANAPADGNDAFGLIGQVTDDGTQQFQARYPNNRHPLGNSLAGASDASLDAVHHRLFVADGGNDRVLVYRLNDANGFISDTPDIVLGQASRTYSVAALGANGLTDPTSVAYDESHDYLYVADSASNRVLVFDAAHLADNMNASFVLGQPDFLSASGAVGANSLDTPWGVAVDPVHHRLFVSETGAARIVVYDTSELSNGMEAAHAIGAPDLETAGGGVGNNRLTRPEYMAYDAAHDRLFVSDQLASRVIVFDTAVIENNMAAAAVLGQPDFTSGDEGLAAGMFSRPEGVAYDSVNDRLFVSDTGHSRVMVFDAGALANGQAATGVLGAEDFMSVIAGTSQNTLLSPLGMVYGKDTGLMVMDAGNSRIMRYTFASPRELPQRNAVVGERVAMQLSLLDVRGTAGFSAEANSLPPGLILQSDGVISGIPTTAGTYTFTVKGEDDTGSTGVFFTRRSYTIAVSKAAHPAPLPPPTASKPADPGPAAVLFKGGDDPATVKPRVSFTPDTPAPVEKTADKLYLRLLWWLPILIPLVWAAVLYRRRHHHKTEANP